MSRPRKAAIIAGVVLVLLILFQLLLAAGLPLGRAAWGGEHRVLPANLRWGSVFAVLILAIAAYVVLAQAGLIARGVGTKPVRVATWFFACYFTLNTVMNALSDSAPERYIMTPVSAVLVVCFFLAGWFGSVTGKESTR